MIHLIAGLGANQMAFSKIRGALGDGVRYVPWLPVDDGETLDSYAQKIIATYGMESSHMLIGLSFGGLLAQKIASILGNEHIILISSFRDKRDIQTILRLLMETQGYKLNARLKLKHLSGIIKMFLSPKSRTGTSTLDEMIADTDMRFTKWAIEQIRVTSQITIEETQVHNILGKKDRLIRYWENSTTYTIEQGGHFMIYEHHHEVIMAIGQVFEAIGYSVRSEERLNGRQTDGLSASS